MVFEIIKDENIDENEAKEKLISSAYEYFKDDLDVEVKFVNYSEGKSKKQKDFESFVEDEES
jgi:phosphoenolpyruvate carboxylase